MDQLCFAKPIHCDRSTLLRKAYPSWWICFASQSLSIMMDGLCFAKPFQWWIGFASQSQSILIGLLCFAKPIHCGGLEWLCFAKPFQWFSVRPFWDLRSRFTVFFHEVPRPCLGGLPDSRESGREEGQGTLKGTAVQQSVCNEATITNRPLLSFFSRSRKVKKSGKIDLFRPILGKRLKNIS